MGNEFQRFSDWMEERKTVTQDSSPAPGSGLRELVGCLWAVLWGLFIWWLLTSG
jgi:hypothetical protein